MLAARANGRSAGCQLRTGFRLDLRGRHEAWT